MAAAQQQVESVVLESRGGSDKHDRRALERLRRHRHLPASLRVAHEPKHSPLLQLADFVASAYVAAHHHDETGPWKIISHAHVIDVRQIVPR